MEFENLIALIQAVSDSSLTGLKYEEKGVKISLTKDMVQIQTQGEAPVSMPVQAAVKAAPAKAEKEMEKETAPVVSESEGSVMKSPLVGTFYAAPSEDAEAFVKVGDTVKSGQILAIVEAMKLMNDIESEYDGTIAEVYVKNGEAVEYGQPLFRIV